MAPVKLYVYDLSRGMAKSMSLALTGKQIDGIWHTSVVVFGRETFFGQGILHAAPGSTHHGQPQQIIDMGETQLDEETYNEYIESMAEEYTAEKYHLMEFNCNHFTADVVGFLTGGTIPEWISGLPAEFLATPFGQQLRPMIDQMFRGRSSTEHRVNPHAGPSTSPLPTPPATRAPTSSAASLLASVAQAAAGTSTPSPAVKSLTTPLALITSLSNFDSILSQNTAVIVNFTNTPTCPPCRAIKPIYESLASDMAPTYAAKGVRFLEVELGMGEGREIASRHGVHATPTFQFFRDGKKVDELKGASKRDLEGKVESFLEECFPRHRHRRVYLPTIEHLSIDPIRSGTIPNYAALLGKLEGFAQAGTGAEDGVRILKERVVPLLEGKVGGGDEQKAIFEEWTRSTIKLLDVLKPEETFPVIDLWRIGLLQPAISSLIALSLSPTTGGVDPIGPILSLASSTIQSQGPGTPKPFLLTVLRALTNLLASLPLANLLLGSASSSQSDLITILVDSLLHPDAGVRTAAGGVAINIANWRHRSAKATGIPAEEAEEQEWEVEVLSAILEALGREEDEDVSHRLLVALAQICYLAKGFEGSLEPLLEVLGAKDLIQSRKGSWKKKEVKKLAEEVKGKLI